MFPSARWKAYLRDLQSIARDNAAEDDPTTSHKVIYHILHSEKLWFTRDETNNHQKDAEEHLERCDEFLQDCTARVDALEETLANTPKPSEVLDWCRLW